MSTVSATHGCTSVPCGICGSSSGFGPWKSIRFIPPTSQEWVPFRVEGIVCPCNTPGDFPQPCGIHNPGLIQAHTWTATELHLLAPPTPRAPFADGVIPQIGWRES